MDEISQMLRILGDIGSQDTQARLEAVRFLGENWDDRAIQPLCEALLRDKSLDVRESAAHSLSKIDRLGESADALLKAIENHRDADWFGPHPSEYCVLTTVVRALGTVCVSHEDDAPFHSEVIKKLTEIMLDSSLVLPTGWPREGFENGRCNAAAAVALAYVGHENSIRSLIEAFNQHYSTFEFDKEGYDEEIGYWDADEDALSRENFVNHTSTWAMWAIGSIGHTDALPQLRDMISGMMTAWKNDKFEWWELSLWSSVVQAIGKCGDNSVHVFNPSQLLWNFFQDLTKKDPGYNATPLRHTILSTLIEIHDSDLISRLIEVLKEDIPLLQELAAKSLGEIGDPVAVQPLCENIRYLIANYDPYDGWGWRECCPARAAIRALGEIGDASCIDTLVQSLWWEEEAGVNLDLFMHLSEDSVLALVSIGTDRAVDELIRFLNDSESQPCLCASPLIRLYIIEELQEMEVDKSIEVLIGRIGDDDLEVRAAAACALGYFRAENAIEPLTELLNRDPDPDAELLEGLPWESDRIQSAIALGKIGNSDSSEDLVKALNDPHQWIRAGAAQGLVHFVDECHGWPAELTKPLSLAFNQDECEDVRKYSRIALAKIFIGTCFNFPQSQAEAFGDIAEGFANKIYYDQMLDNNLKEGKIEEGLKWLEKHGYR